MKYPMITEYLSPKEVRGITKLATPSSTRPVVSDDEVARPDWKRRAGVVGAGLLGMGLGTAGSFTALELLDRYKRRNGGQGIPLAPLVAAVPALGGAAALAYSLWKAKELEEMQRAVHPRPDDEPSGG